MRKYILAMDQGTASSKAVVFDKKGCIVGKVEKEFDQIYPKAGWIEHDANEIWFTQASVVEEVLDLADIDVEDIAAIGITNQRETTIIWDRLTGEPINNAIVWQDRRTSKICDSLKLQGFEEIIKDKTGLLLDAYFSGTKIKWMLDNIEGLRKRADKGELAFGTVDSWLVWKLTGGKVHITDVSNASRTMLYNINSLEWDEKMLEILDIPVSILPKVCSSSEIYGYTDASLYGREIPIAGIGGHQQAALFGQMCVDKGMLTATYNTGCFILMNIGDKPIKSMNNMLTTIAWQIGDKLTYALEGSVFSGGAVVQWLRDEMNIINSVNEIEQLALTEEDSGGVYIVPAFTGLGAPHWDQYARGTFWGLNMGTTIGHIARATMESMAFSTSDVMEAMEKDSGIKIKELRAGGTLSNKTLLKFQSDIFNIPVVKSSVDDMSALGAVYLAGLAVGFWKDMEEIKSNWELKETYSPSMDEKKINHYKHYWIKAVERSMSWIDTEE
jgi:glycerol kinase